jgi:hypothetical protein
MVLSLAKSAMALLTCPLEFANLPAPEHRGLVLAIM